jgi:putative transcriptional regulator
MSAPSAKPLTLPWLLVATPQLVDDNFKKAVVLIVEHGDKGSMGFVINRPIGQSLADIVTVPEVEIPANIPVWYGGPVETGTGIILHCRPRDNAPKGEFTLRGDVGADEPAAGGAGVVLSSSTETLIDLVDHSRRSAARPTGLAQMELAPSPEAGAAWRYPYRFLVGYTGWGPGQLETEVRQGAWIQAPAPWELIFDANWKTLWDVALGTVGANPRTLVTTSQQYLN